MSARNTSTSQSGFTLVELTIAMSLMSVLAIGIFAFFGTSIKSYFRMQEDSLAISDVAANSQRIANVIRGATEITIANNNNITMYSYFSPNDQYVSLIKYYPDGTGTKLLADVTHMTSNPPVGTPITSSLKTVTIIESFYLPTGANMFEYLDSSGGNLSTPISDLHTIKGVRVNLASRSGTNGTVSKMSVEVALRNRKTNL